MPSNNDDDDDDDRKNYIVTIKNSIGFFPSSRNRAADWEFSAGGRCAHIYLFYMYMKN